MKKIKLILLFICFITVAQIVFAQINKSIKQIRREVAAIDVNLKTFKKTTKDINEISNEGAEATFFSADKKLKKITAKIYGETFNGSTELYYKITN